MADKKPISKEYLLTQLKNFDKEIINKNYTGKKQAEKIEKSIGDVTTIKISSVTDLVTAINALYDSFMSSITYADKKLTIAYRNGKSTIVDISSIIVDTNLGELSNVNDEGVQDKQVLSYDEATSKYVPTSLDLAGLLKDSKDYTDEQVSKINSMDAIAVDEKPTCSDGVITYKKDGETLTAENSDIWFYYSVDDMNYQTLFIDGIEFTTSVDGDVDFKDFVSKTNDVVSTYTGEETNKDKVVTIGALDALYTIIATALGKKVNTADIVDTLESDAVNKPLSANQGKVLNAKIDEHINDEDSHVSADEKAAWNKAQENIVETVKVNGEELTLDENKAVDIDLSDYAKNNEVSDIKMLGWNVPKECNWRNEIIGNQYKVNGNRIELSKLNWEASPIASGCYDVYFFELSFFNTPTIKPTNIYCKDYDIISYNERETSTITKGITVYNDEKGMSISIKDTSFSNINDFKDSLVGKYLYYEYVPSKRYTININGNEVVTHINDSIEMHGLKIYRFIGNGYYEKNQSITQTARHAYTQLLPVHEGSILKVKLGSNIEALWMQKWYNDSRVSEEQIAGGAIETTITVPSGIDKISFSGYNYDGILIDNIDFYVLVDNAIDILKTEIEKETDQIVYGEIAGGKNIWDEKWELGDLDNNGQEINVSYMIRNKGYISVKSDTSYFLVSNVSGSIDVFFYDENNTFISLIRNSDAKNKSFVTPNNAKYMRFYITGQTNYTSGVAIIEGTSGTYKPYVMSNKQLTKVNDNLNGLTYGIDGAYNLLKPTLENITQNGLTITKGDNGTYILNGTVNEDYATIRLSDSFIVSETRTYRFCLSGKKDNKVSFNIWEDSEYITSTDEGIIELKKDKSYILVIIVREGTFNNYIIKPIITADLSYTVDKFKPYVPSVKTLAEKTTQIDDLNVLGWVVPEECPIKNIKNGNQFIQKVGRVDLGSLTTWQYDSTREYFDSRELPKRKFTFSALSTRNTIWCKKYPAVVGEYPTDKTIGEGWGAVYIKDSSYTDVDTFKQAMQGVYLYYELAKPITMQIDGNEVGETISDVRKETTINLLKPTLGTTEQNGITCTANGDGTYTLNGTASETTIFELLSTGKFVDGIKRKFIWKKESTTFPKQTRISMVVLNNGEAQYTDLTGNETFAFNSSNLWIRIYVAKGEVINNEIIKPMVTTNLDATYDDFVPYTGSTGALNSDVAELRRDMTFKTASTTWKGLTFVFYKQGRIGYVRTYGKLTSELAISDAYDEIVQAPEGFEPAFGDVSYLISNRYRVQFNAQEKKGFKLGYAVSIIDGSTTNIPVGTDIYIQRSYIIA